MSELGEGVLEWMRSGDFRSQVEIAGAFFFFFSKVQFLFRLGLCLRISPLDGGYHRIVERL